MRYHAHHGRIQGSVNVGISVFGMGIMPRQYSCDLVSSIWAFRSCGPAPKTNEYRPCSRVGCPTSVFIHWQMMKTHIIKSKERSAPYHVQRTAGNLGGGVVGGSGPSSFRFPGGSNERPTPYPGYPHGGPEMRLLYPEVQKLCGKSCSFMSRRPASAHSSKRASMRMWICLQSAASRISAGD